DPTLRAVEHAGHAGVALGPDPDWPVDRGAAAHPLLPLLADAREVGREDLRRAAAVTPVDDVDGCRRERLGGVELRDPRVVPIGDLTEEYPRHDVGRELELVGRSG